MALVSEISLKPCMAEDEMQGDFYADQYLEQYTYENMQDDIEKLQEKYGAYIQISSLGQSADGRELYDLVIGDTNAEKKIFINAGIHAREYITCQLVMKQAEAFLEHIANNDDYEQLSDLQNVDEKSCNEVPYKEMWENCQIHVMPMVNPDGVAIRQKGLSGLQTEEMRTKVTGIAALDGQEAQGDYLINWKSNGCGIDLNRNFDALWDSYADPVGHPSSSHYKGPYPGSEKETDAMITLTEEQNFARTVSYHAQGNVIYWYFGQEGQLYEDTKAFGEWISALTGYVMDADYQSLDPAGYKDWAISQKGIPSLTIEVGRDTVPVPEEQFDEIWNANKNVWEECVCAD